MNQFKEIKAEELKESPFHLIGKDWMLITAKKDGKVNTMTASWGGLGVMWNKNVAFVVIRPQRYTKEFVEFTDRFSLSFFDAAYKDKLSYLGSVSGRDEDKITQSELTVNYPDGETPAFAEAKMVLIVKKLFNQDFKPESFLKEEILEKWYPDKDYHTLYIAEIEKILMKEDK